MQETYVRLHSPRFFYFILFISIALQASLGNGAVIAVGPSESIQDAINRAKIGDILEISSGYYEESIYVDKPLVIQGQNASVKPAIIEAKNSEVTVVLDADGCSLERLVIKNNKGSGIYVLSDYNRIFNNSIDAQTSIHLEDCQRNNIAKNIVSGSQYLGTGIKLTQSSNNNLAKNTAFGGLLSSAIELGNGSNNNTIVDNFASNYGWWGDGINLQDSCDNTILRNTAITASSFLGANGICISWSSNNNTLRENTVEGSGWKGNGIYVFISDNNTFAYNNISSKDQSESDGIFLFNSDHNTIVGNNVSDNGDYGIDLLYSCDNNTIMNNIIKDNAKGMFIGGKNNSIYLNNFIRNGISAYSWVTINRWCTPEPKIYQYQGKTIQSYLGNRWSDYQGIDTNRDEIGDRPYVFRDGNDDYPLMETWEKYVIKIAIKNT